jgi:hypothetical protein
MAQKNIPIDYTARDFKSIKEALVDYTRRYYSTNYKDFSEASFGSLMLDSVAYIGDILSFYLDYQVNESFFATAVEYENVLKHARQLGYKVGTSFAASGPVALYIVVPVDSSGAKPDTRYMPILRRGGTFYSVNGDYYTLAENVDFSASNNEIVPAEVGSNGFPLSFAIKAYGQVVSGRRRIITRVVGDYQQFLKVPIGGSNVIEVLSVIDNQGREYFEVEHLSQNFVYRAVPNRSTDKELVKEILKPIAVPRRYMVERNSVATFIQFGQGSDLDIDAESIADPSNVVMNLHGKDFVSDRGFDPTKLLKTDKMGISPSNTTLTVTYRENTAGTINAAAGAIVSVANSTLDFKDRQTLNESKISTTISSLEVFNEEPILGQVSLPDPTEVKLRAMSHFASQNRAVTREDYISLCYNMPSEFGGIKRANIIQDRDSFKRNLNLYILSENTDSTLTTSPKSLKKNLKTWLNKHKMLNDTIDILDPRIINLGISFVAIGEKDYNKYDLLLAAVSRLQAHFARLPELGEPFYITEIYKILNKMQGIVDVVDVKIEQKKGAPYSTTPYDLSLNKSADGVYVHIPENVIWEIKYPIDDIKGEIR